MAFTKIAFVLNDIKLRKPVQKYVILWFIYYCGICGNIVVYVIWFYVIGLVCANDMCFCRMIRNISDI